MSFHLLWSLVSNGENLIPVLRDDSFLCGLRLLALVLSQEAIERFIWGQVHLFSTLFCCRHVSRHGSDCSTRGRRRRRRRRRGVQRRRQGRLVVGHGLFWGRCWHALASLSTADLHDCLLFRSSGHYGRSWRWRWGRRRQGWRHRNIGCSYCRACRFTRRRARSILVAPWTSRLARKLRGH